MIREGGGLAVTHYTIVLYLLCQVEVDPTADIEREAKMAIIK